MTELENARAKYAMWSAAEDAAATGQSYRIGTRQLTRADLSEIRRQMAYWQGEIDRLMRGGRRGARVIRVIPRDL